MFLCTARHVSVRMTANSNPVNFTVIDELGHLATLSWTLHTEGMRLLYSSRMKMELRADTLLLRARRFTLEFQPRKYNLLAQPDARQRRYARTPK